MELNQFRDVDLVIDKANDNFIQRQFVSQGDYRGRTMTVQVTDNGLIGKVPGLTLNLRWRNQASGLADLSAFECIDDEYSVFRIEYPEQMMTPGKVVANIQVIQNGHVTHLKSFEMTVQALAGEMTGIVEKAEYGALVAVLADANKFRTDIDNLEINKATKDELDAEATGLQNAINRVENNANSGLSSKVDKNGAGQVNWGMLAQDARNNISGDKVATVGDNAVGTSNYVNNSITNAKIKDGELYGKKIALEGYMPDFYFGVDLNIPVLKITGDNVVFNTDQLTSGALIYRNKITSLTFADYSIDTTTFPFDPTNSNWIFIDPIAKVLYVGRGDITDVKTRNLLYAGLYGPAGNRQRASVPFPIEVDGVVVYPNKKRPYESPGYLAFADGVKAKLDLANNKLILPTGDKVALAHDRGYQISKKDGTNNKDQIEVPFDGTSGWQFLYYDWRNDLFYFKSTSGFGKYDQSDAMYLGHVRVSTGQHSLQMAVEDVITATVKYSILGTSIDTFEGFLPEGNRTFFPQTFMSDVNSTWWKRMEQANPKMQLLVNNSWSGSRVCETSDTEPLSAFTKRANLLHVDTTNPDVIFVMTGPNDINFGTVLGNFDGTIGADMTVYANALAQTLKTIAETYPLAKVYVSTVIWKDYKNQGKVIYTDPNGKTVDQWNDQIKKIAKSFGCGIIDLQSCGVNAFNFETYLGDGTHPNVKGMQLISDVVSVIVR